MEDEILKHTNKAIKELKNTEHSFWHKAKEIGIEICIIVFAVTLSIWLHSWSEVRTQRKEVREFLSDLKEDLTADIGSLQLARTSLIKSRESFKFIAQLTKKSIEIPFRAFFNFINDNKAFCMR